MRTLNSRIEDCGHAVTEAEVSATVSLMHREQQARRRLSHGPKVVLSREKLGDLPPESSHWYLHGIFF